MTTVFDFDKTLTRRDTLLGFYLFCNHRPKAALCCMLGMYFVIQVLHKLKFLTNDTLKRLGVWMFLRGQNQEWVENRAREYSTTIQLNRVYREVLPRHKDAYIVTASFRDYVKHLFPQYIVIGSELSYLDGKVASVTVNCHGTTKLRLLKEAGIGQIDRFYTDSKSDLPLASIASEAFLVRGDEVSSWDIPDN